MPAPQQPDHACARRHPSPSVEAMAPAQTAPTRLLQPLTQQGGVVVPEERLGGRDLALPAVVHQSAVAGEQQGRSRAGLRGGQGWPATHGTPRASGTHQNARRVLPWALGLRPASPLKLPSSFSRACTTPAGRQWEVRGHNVQWHSQLPPLPASAHPPPPRSARTATPLGAQSAGPEFGAPPSCTLLTSLCTFVVLHLPFGLRLRRCPGGSQGWGKSCWKKTE